MDRQLFDTYLYIYLMDRGSIEPFEIEIIWKLFRGEVITANGKNQKMHVLTHVAKRIKEIEYRIENLPKIPKVKVV